MDIVKNIYNFFNIESMNDDNTNNSDTYSKMNNNKNNNNNNNNKNVKSIAFSQGAQYNQYQEQKINNSIQGSIQGSFQGSNPKNNNPTIEGFASMDTSISGNILLVEQHNNKESKQLQKNEDEFNRNISNYANAQKNLLEKTTKFLQTNKAYGKNIYSVQPQKSEDIKPNWVGCYKSGNDGLTEQTDLGTNADMNSCKVRASDLGYSVFSLRKDAENGGTRCYVGDSIDLAQANGLVTASLVSYAFSKGDGATMGGLLQNGQIGVFQDDITNNLVTDLTAVGDCDLITGGTINANNIVATYGYNCNGIEKSKFTAPPPPPAPIPDPTPDGYTKYSNLTSAGNDMIRLSFGTPITDLVATCNKNVNCVGFNSGGWLKSALLPQNQWKKNVYKGKSLDLYVKNKPIVTIDTTITYRLQNVNSSKCLYSNADGRFNTYTCLAYDDQYWNLTKIDNETNVYMCTSVNSAKSLYNNKKGNVGVYTTNKGSGIKGDDSLAVQYWELIPITNQPDVYQFKNVNSSNCMSNNFNTYKCDQTHTDQLWKLIPITAVATDPVTNAPIAAKTCDQYTDTDKNIPSNCIAQMWKDSGCTTGGPPTASVALYTNGTMTKKDIQTDMNIYVKSSLGDKNNALCYAPVPIVMTGSSINTGSLWSNPWSIINDGGVMISISSTNDGGMICANNGGNIYARSSFKSSWVQLSNNGIAFRGIIQLQDNSYIGIGKSNYQLYQKTNLTDKSWNGPLTNSGGVLAITQLKDGTLVCAGTDNSLYHKRNLTDKWNKLTCPESCCVIYISVFNDGTLVGVGTNGFIYTKENLISPWVLKDKSAVMLAITQMKDGTILGVGPNQILYKK